MGQPEKWALRVAVLSLWFAIGVCAAPILSEDFSGTFPPAGWIVRNNSEPPGDDTWRKGAAATLLKSGGGDANFAAVSYESAGGHTAQHSTATASNWLISPAVTLHNGDILSFGTSGFETQDFPDRLQVRLSLTEAGTDVGTSSGSVGTFTRLLADINPSYAATGEPGTYPTDWTTFSLTIGGLQASAPGRLAFRYFVEDSSPDGSRGNEIGIDDIVVAPEPSALWCLGVVAAFMRRPIHRALLRHGTRSGNFPCR